MSSQITMTPAEFHRLIGRRPPAQTRPPALAPVHPEAAQITHLLHAVEALAVRYKWKGQHTWNAQGPESGLECTLVREALIVAALLGPHGPVSTGQQAWLAALRQANVEVYEWRSRDLPAIEARLAWRP
jgi:hypothetical protein